MAMIICLIFSLLMIAMGIYIYSGKGWFLIAGYNMYPESDREKYDEKALCRFDGKVIIAIGLLMIPIGIESIAKWYWIVFTVITLIIGITASVYSNTRNRFMK